MTPSEFRDFACDFAVKQRSTFIHDADILPLIRQRGVSEVEFNRLKTVLEHQGIHNHRVLTGIADFEVDDQLFFRYYLTTLPTAKLANAKRLYQTWLREGVEVTSSRLAAELNVPDVEGGMLLGGLRLVC